MRLRHMFALIALGVVLLTSGCCGNHCCRRRPFRNCCSPCCTPCCSTCCSSPGEMPAPPLATPFPPPLAAPLPPPPPVPGANR